MGDRDVKEAWRFYLLNWMPVFFLALLLIVGLVVTDFSLKIEGLFPVVVGMITFPSFHAAAGVLAIWAFWGVWWMRPFALIVYIAMILATPLVGGRYFIDVLAGVGLAVLAIILAKRVGENRSVAAPIVTRDAVTA